MNDAIIEFLLFYVCMSAIVIALSHLIMFIDKNKKL